MQELIGEDETALVNGIKPKTKPINITNQYVKLFYSALFNEYSLEITMKVNDLVPSRGKTMTISRSNHRLENNKLVTVKRKVKKLVHLFCVNVFQLEVDFRSIIIKHIFNKMTNLRRK